MAKLIGILNTCLGHQPAVEQCVEIAVALPIALRTLVAAIEHPHAHIGRGACRTAGNGHVHCVQVRQEQVGISLHALVVLTCKELPSFGRLQADVAQLDAQTCGGIVIVKHTDTDLADLIIAGCAAHLVAKRFVVQGCTITQKPRDQCHLALGVGQRRQHLPRDHKLGGVLRVSQVSGYHRHPHTGDIVEPFPGHGDLWHLVKHNLGRPQRILAQRIGEFDSQHWIIGAAAGRVGLGAAQRDGHLHDAGVLVVEI